MIYGVSFSHAPNSMGRRGLQLMSEYIPFDRIIQAGDYDIPVVNRNRADGVVPDSVRRFNDDLAQADGYVFSISEMTGAMCGAYKNALDWLVIAQNADGITETAYSISHKPSVICTFTPSYRNGSRHWEMTGDLMQKLNCDIRKWYLFNDCLTHLRPGNAQFVQAESLEAYELIRIPNPPRGIENNDGVRTMSNWMYMYDEWESSWNT